MLAALKEAFRRLLPSRSDSAPVDRYCGSRKRGPEVSQDGEVDDADAAVASNSRKRVCAGDTCSSSGRSPNGVAADAVQSPVLPIAQPTSEQTTSWPPQRFQDSPSSSGHTSRPSLLSGERVQHDRPVQNHNVGLGRSLSATAANPSRRPHWPLPQPSRERTAFQPLEQSRNSRPSGRASLLSAERVEHRGAAQNHEGMRRSLFARPAVPLPSRREELLQLVEWCRRSRPSSDALRPPLLSGERVEDTESVQNHNDGLGNSHCATAADQPPRTALPLAQSSGEQAALRPLERFQGSRPSVHASRPSLPSVERAQHDGPVQNNTDSSGNSRSGTATDPSQRPALPLEHHSRQQTAFRPHEQSGHSRSSGRASRPFLFSPELEGDGRLIRSHSDNDLRGLGGARAMQPKRSLLRSPGHNLVSSNEAIRALSMRSGRCMTAAQYTRIQHQEVHKYRSLLPHQGATFRSVSTTRTNCTEAQSMWRLSGQQSPYTTVALESSMRYVPNFSSSVQNYTSLTECSVAPTMLSEPISSMSSEPIRAGDPVTLDMFSRRNLLSPKILMARVAPPLLPVLPSSHFYSRKWLEDLKKRLTYMDQSAEARILSKEQSCERHSTHFVSAIKVPFVSNIPVDIPTFPNLTTEMEAAVDDALRRGAPDEVLVIAFGLPITRKDVKTLADLKCLNDEVVNFYMNMLVERSRTQPTLPSVFAFNTFFYPKLRAKGYGAVKTWTRRVDIFAHDLLLVPVLQHLHWCLFAIDFRHKAINYYDPLGNEDDECFKTLCGYLEKERRNRRREQFDLSGWTLDSVKDIQYQLNFSDCGIFVLNCAEHITRNAKPTFSQQHMPYFRKCVAYEILTKKLL